MRNLWSITTDRLPLRRMPGTSWPKFGHSSRCVTGKFLQCFSPSRDLSIDEAMIRFDGRLAWKQYMPKKPVKWGIKLWCLCDANTGYCLVFSVYTGSDENAGANLDLGYRVVMSLMRRHLHSYHHLYADNFFTSVHLAVDLKQADTSSVAPLAQVGANFRSLSLLFISKRLNRSSGSTMTV